LSLGRNPSCIKLQFVLVVCEHDSETEIGLCSSGCRLLRRGVRCYSLVEHITVLPYQALLMRGAVPEDAIARNDSFLPLLSASGFN
jgi:hypothetical protein